MLLAVKLWAVAHLLANGTLADVLLFGGFLAWAVADRISVKRRARGAGARGPGGAAAARRTTRSRSSAGCVVYALFIVLGASLADRRLAARLIAPRRA